MQIYKTDKDNTEKVQTTLFNYLKSDEITSYAKSICNKIYNRFQIYIEPDDILSMTYLALSTPRRVELLTRDTFDQEKLKLYIMRVVRNAAFKTLKKEKEQKIQISGLRTTSGYNFDTDLSIHSDYKDWSGRVRETKEAQRLIDYARELETLLQEAPISDRYKLVLQTVINYSRTRDDGASKKDLMKEIADALGINPDGSHPKVMLHRARTGFIKYLKTVDPCLPELFPILTDKI